MAIPSLAMIPSGYKDGKVYSVLPSNGDGDFTFSRGSNATRVNKDGLIETVTGDTPRLDYSDSSCPSLLLEPQSTNLIEYSEDFSNSYWSKIGSGSGVAPIVTAEYAISPDGTQNATRVQFDAVGSTNSDRSSLVRDFAFTTGQTYSISCWVKSTNGTSQVIQFRIAGSQTSEEQTATSEWKLYTATFTATASTTDQFGMQIRGINSVNESDILIYGMQLELLDYNTSYIPTNGAIATRLADVCNDAGTSDTFNDSEGVLMAEISALDNDEIKEITLSNGGNAERILLSYNSIGRLDVNVIASDTYQAAFNYTNINSTEFNKILISYKQNDFKLFVNGFKVGNSLSGNIPSGLDTINFGATYNASVNSFYGNTKQIQYYDSALTDSDLEELTSWESFLDMAAGQNYTIK